MLWVPFYRFMLRSLKNIIFNNYNGNGKLKIYVMAFLSNIEIICYLNISH